MLDHLHIKNFAIIDNLDLEFKTGMTVITGETGAGKSIVIDALDIALGDRADTKLIRHGCDRCEIHVSFSITEIPKAQQWLKEKELYDEDQCLIRRVTSLEGRSRSYINGSPVTLQQLRELAKCLIHIHSQHENHALMKKDEQRQLVDRFAKHPALLNKVTNHYQQWQQAQQRHAQLKEQLQQQQSQQELWQYHLEELNQLALQPKELEQLHQEHKILDNAQQLMGFYQEVLGILDTDEPSVNQLLSQAQQRIAQAKLLDNQLVNSETLLNQSLLHLQEALQELHHCQQSRDLNDDKLQQVEQRLSTIHDLARKHRIAPEKLYEHHQQLQQTIETLQQGDEQLALLAEQAQQHLLAYHKVAQQLSQSRQKAAKKLASLVSKSIRLLGIPKGEFSVAFKVQEPTLHGIDSIDFQVTANPGQPLQSLSKVASGGELSRISLAIQVLTAQSHCTPTLIFDEVDVGIGGGTAEIIGQLMQQLGKKAQVICITHLPQVAAQGDHHLQITKTMAEDSTISQLIPLQGKQRIQEIARMLGGVKITPQTVAHAQEMLGDLTDIS